MRNQPRKTQATNKGAMPHSLVFGIIMVSIFGVIAGFFSSPISTEVRSLLSQLFAYESGNVTWYITRSAGIIAYLLLWLSTAWGLAIPSKIIERFLHGSYTFEFHQFISLLSLGFLALHVLILLIDPYLTFTWTQILFPFFSLYRPLWVGVGILSLYLIILVTVTFYMRRRIGMKAFRYIHYTSLAGYLGATAHGLFAGTDSSLPIALFMYAGSFLVIVFLTAYWLYLVWQGKRSDFARTKMPSRQATS